MIGCSCCRETCCWITRAPVTSAADIASSPPVCIRPTFPRNGATLTLCAHTNRHYCTVWFNRCTVTLGYTVLRRQSPYRRTAVVVCILILLIMQNIRWRYIKCSGTLPTGDHLSYFTCTHLMIAGNNTVPISVCRGGSLRSAECRLVTIPPKWVSR